MDTSEYQSPYTAWILGLEKMVQCIALIGWFFFRSKDQYNELLVYWFLLQNNLTDLILKSSH